jgi:hypothetical protein
MCEKHWGPRAQHVQVLLTFNRAGAEEFKVRLGTRTVWGERAAKQRGGGVGVVGGGVDADWHGVKSIGDRARNTYRLS